MTKANTDEGLGPGSEPRRRELAKLNADGKPKKVDKNAVTEPGIGKVERKDDAVDQLLEGFGRSRPDLPRILPPADTTPPLEPIQKELTPTSPGKRQRVRNIILATALSFGVITALGVGIVKLATHDGPAPTGSATSNTQAPTVSTVVATTATVVTAPPPTIATMEVEALPSVRTGVPLNVSTSRPPTHSTASAGTTATAPTRPTGSVPPGMGLLPDDPHR
jgi:hypothetical protein